MITKTMLADACRASDNLSDTGKSTPEVLTHANVDVDGAMHVACQRALRMVISMRGESMPMIPTAVRLTAQEEDLLATLATMWIDGMLAGIKTKRREIAELVKKKIAQWQHSEDAAQILISLGEELKP